jgi:uncharacterized protein (TIGR02271 family)
LLSTDQLQTLTSATAYDTQGNKIGRVGQVYLDDQTGQPEWFTVNTGLFGANESFVPLAQADLQGDRLVVPHGKDQVKDAPNVDPGDGHLSEQEETSLYRHYGLDSSFEDQPAGTDTFRDEGAVGRDTSGPTTDEAMTRSEEQLRVGTEQREAGRARLRKYVVTENVQTTVPVSREEVRVEREPITDANVGQAVDGPDISEEEHEVTLHAERPVVETEAVPVERVRLAKETVTDHETVSGEVRKEQIDTDGVDDTAGRLR